MTLNTPIIKKGKLMTVGSSVVIAVPPEWLSDKGLKAGNEIVIIANGNLTIMKNDEETKEKLARHISHITRSDEDSTGEKRQAQVSPMNENSLRQQVE